MRTQSRCRDEGKDDDEDDLVGDLWSEDGGSFTPEDTEEEGDDGDEENEKDEEDQVSEGGKEKGDEKSRKSQHRGTLKYTVTCLTLNWSL